LSIKAQIWDFEGVLLKTQEESVPTSVAKRLGTPLDKVQTVFHSEFNDRTDYGEFQQIHFWHHLLDTLGLPRADVAKLWTHLEEDVFIDQHLLDIVRGYHASYKTAMVSKLL